jgi:HEPN domain-containing protein
LKKIDVDTTMLDLLTQSYITSRYLPYSFSKETAEKALSFAEKIMKELNCLS